MSITSDYKAFMIVEVDILRTKTNTTLNYRIEIEDNGAVVTHTASINGSDTEESVRDRIKTKSTANSGNQVVKVYAVTTSGTSGSVSIQDVMLDVLVQPAC